MNADGMAIFGEFRHDFTRINMHDMCRYSHWDKIYILMLKLIFEWKLQKIHTPHLLSFTGTQNNFPICSMMENFIDSPVTREIIFVFYFVSSLFDKLICWFCFLFCSIFFAQNLFSNSVRFNFSFTKKWGNITIDWIRKKSRTLIVVVVVKIWFQILKINWISQ